MISLSPPGKLFEKRRYLFTKRMTARLVVCPVKEQSSHGENQGMQIALIAAVILTLIFGGLSFYFYKQYTEANVKEQAATKNEGEAKRKGDELAKLVAVKKEAGFKETDQEADCTRHSRTM